MGEKDDAWATYIRSGAALARGKLPSRGAGGMAGVGRAQERGKDAPSNCVRHPLVYPLVTKLQFGHA